MRLTSTQNPTVKYLRSLDRSSVRWEHGVYLAEGVRLVSEAVSSGQLAAIVLYDPVSLSHSQAGSLLLAAIPGWAERAFEADDRILRAAAQTENPGGVVAALRMPSVSPDRNTSMGRGVVLDGLADPGNIGTLLRSAAAFGVEYVLTSPGSADLFAPKVVRAAMGAHFRLTLVAHQDWDVIEKRNAHTPFIALDAHSGTELPAFVWPHHGVLVVGSEAHGLSAAARQVVRHTLRIPHQGAVESLNAGVAASIALYAWQESLKTSG